MAMWGADFERIYPGVRVELDDATFEDVGGGACTFGPRVGVMWEHTAKMFERRFGYAATELPVCLYVPMVVVHRDNPHDGGLPIETVDTIFSFDFRDLTWGDLGGVGEWSERPISVYAPRHYAGRLLGQLRPGPTGLFLFKDSVKECPDDAAVVAAVAEDTRRIGLASIGRRTENVRALAIAPKGKTVPVAATAENARNGSYPLTGTFYLALNHDSKGGFELDPLRREFLRYILSREGQAAAVKAGHVAMSAEQAERALALLGLGPTGEGSWDEMLSRLRARGLPRARRERIENLALRIGDRPTDEQLGGLAYALAGTGLTSSVAVATDEAGAVVRCRLFGQPRAVLALDPAGKQTVPIGLYNIWTERDGRETSPSDGWFLVVREHERIKIYEALEAPPVPMDDEAPDR
jgi:phosphate transport system substrate-binding protein